MFHFIPKIIQAAGEVEISLPTVPGIASGTPDKFISTMIGVLTLVAFIYFMFQVIFAGFGFLTSEGDKGKIESSRNRLSQGVIGIIIIVGALVFVNLVGYILGIRDLFSVETILNSFTN